MTNVRDLLFSLAIVLVSAGPAYATLIGTPVDRYGNVLGDGNPLKFYIPLTLDSSGIMGDAGGIGTTSDSCSTYDGTCTGGWLGVILKFEPVQTGENLLDLYFVDLDLNDVGYVRSVNDPYYFLESVKIYDSTYIGGFDLLESVYNATNPVVEYADRYRQTLSLSVDVESNPYYVGLKFQTYFASYTPDGYYRNTREKLYSSLVAVPEPTTLSLLGAGLLVAGFVSRQRKKR